MSEIVLTNQNNPGAIAANVSAFYFNSNGKPSFVGNDGVEHEIFALPSANTGDMYYGNAGSASALPGNTSNVRQFLSQTGNGSASAAPVWVQITAADVSGLSGGYQPLDADLTAIAALSSVGFAVRTANDTWAQRSFTAASTKVTIGNSNGVAGNVSFDIVEANLTLNNIGGNLSATKGGTGLTTYVLGDIIYASAANTIAALAGNTTNTKKFLSQTGNGTASAAPSWSALVASDVPALSALNGTLNANQGGTGVTVYSLGDIIYASAANTLANLPGNTTTTRKFLRQTGNGTASNSPAWDTLQAGDIPSALTGITSINSAAISGQRNRLINGCMRVWQRRTSSVANNVYGFDRWKVLTQTAAITVSQQTGIENSMPYAMRMTQANASAQRFGVEQVIENADCLDLRGQTMTLSARVQCSANTTIRYAILEWTGAADTVTTDVVNNWSSTIYTTGNFFKSATMTVSGTGNTALTANTPTTVSLSASVSSSVNNLIVFFWTDSAQAQNVTVDIGNAQLEIGSTASLFERRPLSEELNMCFRYYEKSYPMTNAPGTSFGAGNQLYTLNTVSGDTSYTGAFNVRKRIAANFIVYDGAGTANKVSYYNGSWQSGGNPTAYIGREAVWYLQTDVVGSIQINFDWSADAEL